MKHTTKHGEKRIKARIAHVNTNELALEARSKGRNIHDFTGSLRRYLDYVRTKKQEGVYLKVYKNKIFIFENERHELVTVINFPNRHMNSLISQIKKLEVNNND